VSRQANLLGISRASLYYKPIIDEADLEAMRVIDEVYTKCPFFGSRKMKPALWRNYAIDIGRHHVRRLMRLMGIEAIHPGNRPKTSEPHPEHKIYPYLLRNITASYSNHIWGADITYIRLAKGWCYLVAILDWFSRYVVGWELSPTMESEFCVSALKTAINNHGAPKISNTDQGSQFTGKEYIAVLENKHTQISMDGRGRCMDNIFTERLWRSLKYEEVYLKSYADIGEARRNLADYFQLYNYERPHQSIDYRTPADVYYKNKKSFAKMQKINVQNPSMLSTTVV
jgi:putative transposase